MAMITVGDDNLQNTTYRAGGVTTLDVVEYLSYNDSIVIKIHGINKCNVKSNYSVNITVKIGKWM